MVSLAAASLTVDSPNTLRRLARDAIDLNLKRTLATEDDPFGRAVLLWTCVRHREQLVNLDALITWARGYSHHVLSDGLVGQKRDEAIAAALLAAAAVDRAGSLSDEELQHVRAGTASLLARDVHPGQVPFDSPAYGAALAVGCRALRVDLPGGLATLRAIAHSYSTGARLARPLGLAFVVEALCGAGLREEVLDVYGRAVAKLANADLNYETRVYLCQAVWLAAQDLGTEAELCAAAAVEETLADSPLYDVLATGQDVIGAAGPSGELGQVSRLYLASLYDLAALYERREAEIIRREREARYASTSGHAWLALVGILFITVTPTALITVGAAPFLAQAADLYLRQQFWSATLADRTVSATVTLGWYGVLILAVTIIQIAFRLARRRVVSDAHLVDEIRRVLPKRLWRAWALAILAGVVAIGWNLVSASIQTPAKTDPPTITTQEDGTPSAPSSQSP